MHKTKRLSSFARARSGFSLVEMIGVLAIIAILAVIIVPKVFSTIASSRITSAAGSVNSMRTAITDFAGKYGTIPLTTAYPNSRIDDLLMTAGNLDSRFLVKLGTQTTVTTAGANWVYANGAWTATGGGVQTTFSRVLSIVAAPATIPSVANGANFRLNGNTNLPALARVVYAVILGVPSADARELSLKIDGDSLSANLGAADNVGKVVFAAPNAATGLTDVYVYIAHQ